MAKLPRSAASICCGFGAVVLQAACSPPTVVQAPVSLDPAAGACAAPTDGGDAAGDDCGSAAPPAITDGGVQVSWSCASSEFQGRQYWTCSRGDLRRCGAGGPEARSCRGLGCRSNPPGIDDECYAPSPEWSCANSQGTDGRQYWTCGSDGNIHACVGASARELVCPYGCNHNPLDTDDTCRAAAGAPTDARAAAGNGYAIIRWSAAGTPRSGFTLAASPGNLVLHAAPNETSKTFPGLTNGVSYAFSISQDGGPAAPTNSVVPGPDANVIVDVAHHPQSRPLTCEEASLVMALTHQHIAKTENDVLSQIGVDLTPATWDADGTLHWGDPFATFVGDPDGDEAKLTGYGTYAPPIAGAAASFGAGVLDAGQGIPPAAVYGAVLANHPVVAWVTSDWTYRAEMGPWITDGGRTIGWHGPKEHAVTIVGVERDFVLVDNPLVRREWQRISKAAFESSYQTYSQMAVILK